LNIDAERQLPVHWRVGVPEEIVPSISPRAMHERRRKRIRFKPQMAAVAGINVNDIEARDRASWDPY
jgi:hypothetical protein